MALTTLPMPAVLPPGLIDYGWPGIRIGNLGTCAAQAFGFYFGIVTMYGYNATLTVYYALVIAFRVREDRIVKYYEPILHAFPILLACGIAIPPLFFIDDLVYKPSVNVWCSIAPSINAELFVNKYFDMEMALITVTYLIILATSFVFIICRVYSVERHFSKIKRSATIRNRNSNGDRNRNTHRGAAAAGGGGGNNNNANGNVNENSRSNSTRQRSSRSSSALESNSTHQNTKVLLVQVLAYTAALLVTISFPLTRVLVMNPESEPDWVVRGFLFLLPLQGFFNLLIFIAHKVYNYRRVHNDVSICNVIMMLLKGEAEELILFSRISLINYENDTGVVEMEVIDEGGNVNVEHYPIFDDADGANDMNANVNVNTNIDVNRKDGQSQHGQPSVMEVMFDENEEENENLDGFDFMLSLSRSGVDQEEFGSDRDPVDGGTDSSTNMMGETNVMEFFNNTRSGGSINKKSAETNVMDSLSGDSLNKTGETNVIESLSDAGRSQRTIGDV